jgi:hypothetical protein
MRAEVIEDALTLGKDTLPHLWQDEQGDIFVLSKHMEIYPYSKSVLGCYCWSRKTYLQLTIMGVIFNDLVSDDRIYRFYTKRENLSHLLSLGKYKRRPHQNGKWLKDRERKLGHRIRPITAEQKSMLRAKFAEVTEYDRQKAKR